jgi:hypothetical protein
MFDLLSQSVVCTCPLSCVFRLPLIVLHVMGLVFLSLPIHGIQLMIVVLTIPFVVLFYW